MSKSDLLFLLTVACIPLQLGKFFFLDFSFVLGIPIDYLAVTIYFTDLVIITYLALFIFENFTNRMKIFKNRKNLVASILVINCYFLVQSLAITKSFSSLYFSLKFLEFSAFGLFATISFSRIAVEKLALKVLVFTLFWQSILIILQFTFQKSLGLWFLGERSFDSATVGIAHAEIFGRQLLRPYGTFPHPNVAGAFLTISLMIVMAAKIQKMPIFLATLLTFSRAALVILAVYFLSSVSKLKYLAVSLLVLLTIAAWLFKSLPQSQIATISERLLLSEAALDITLKNPVFGVGSGNFIPELANLNLFSISEVRLLQPVHNVFLLILVENGIVGLLLFALFLISVLKSANTRTKITLAIAVLVFSSVDHFFLTLNQGRLLFWFAIAAIASSPSRKTQNTQ